MKKIWVNGLIIKVQDNYTSFNFHKVKDVKTSFERNGDIMLLTHNYRIINDPNKGIIDFYYVEGLLTTEIKDTKYIEITDEVEITFEGKLYPEGTSIINGIEYIKNGLHNEVESFSVYLTHYSEVKNRTQNKTLLYGSECYILLIDSIYKDYSLVDYINYINGEGYIYAKPYRINDEDFKIVNIYSNKLKGNILNYEDCSIHGLIEDFYVNDVKISSNFVRSIRELFPEIQFYTSEESRDSTNYNEWICYKIDLVDDNTGDNNTFTSHIWEDETYGANWRGNIPFTFEYSTADLPTLLARKETYRIGKFLYKYQTFDYYIKSDTGVEYPVQYTVFWKRDNIDKHKPQTTEDTSSYKLFSFNISGIISYTNLEHYPIYYDNLIENVIYDVAYNVIDIENTSEEKEYTSDEIKAMYIEENTHEIVGIFNKEKNLDEYTLLEVSELNKEDEENENISDVDTNIGISKEGVIL